ncbi:MAG: hypothetical protein Q8L64_05630 [bacterium]|nr:hypothetical protein [bacterium]
MSASIPFGTDGTLSVNFEKGTANVSLMNVMAGNPTGFARKAANRLGCGSELIPIQGSLAADYRFIFEAPASQDTESFLRSLREKLSEILDITDRFSI